MKIVKQNASVTAAAATLLKKGGVIICPTDTVYGFLADASNKKAVEKIYKIKRRPKEKPLPVFVSSITMANEIAEINSHQAKILKKFWPGAYTFILKKNNPGSEGGSRGALYGVDKKTIAIRIPKHAFLLKLLKKVNRPLAQTSVNISTQKPLKSAGAIIKLFGQNRLVDLILDGESRKGSKSSKIYDFTTGLLTRIR